jgi:hypothetical protein
LKLTTNVVKRDHSVEPFDAQKIQAAVKKCLDGAAAGSNNPLLDHSPFTDASETDR